MLKTDAKQNNYINTYTAHKMMIYAIWRKVKKGKLDRREGYHFKQRDQGRPNRS